jgi:hypothetical protein
MNNFWAQAAKPEERHEAIVSPFLCPPIGDAVAMGTKPATKNTNHMKKKLRSAQRDDSNLAPGSLVNIQQLSELKGPSVRQIRTMVAKKFCTATGSDIGRCSFHLRNLIGTSRRSRSSRLSTEGLANETA